jgi:hypothetical protein
VVSIFESILAQVRSITKRRFKESDKSISQFKFTTSYQTGFLVGLREKLSADRETYLKTSDKKQFELIVVQKDTLVTEWVAANMRIKTGKVKGVALDKGAFEKGKEDGSEKSLNQQLGK